LLGAMNIQRRSRSLWHESRPKRSIGKGCSYLWPCRAQAPPVSGRQASAWPARIRNRRSASASNMTTEHGGKRLPVGADGVRSGLQNLIMGAPAAGRRLRSDASSIVARAVDRATPVQKRRGRCGLQYPVRKASAWPSLATRISSFAGERTFPNIYAPARQHCVRPKAAVSNLAGRIPSRLTRHGPYFLWRDRELRSIWRIYGGGAYPPFAPPFSPAPKNRSI
jgi:hypothetical protein